jgi:hypothetical protein
MTVTQLESFRAVAHWRHFAPRPAFCPQDLSPAKRAMWRKCVEFKQTCFRNPYWLVVTKRHAAMSKPVASGVLLFG